MSIGVIPPVVANFVGSTVLLFEQVASGAASIDVLTRNVARQSGPIFQADFDEYLVEFSGILPSTNATDLYLRMNTGSGFDAGANYVWSLTQWNQAGGGSALGTGAGGVNTALKIANSLSTTATFPYSGGHKFFLPLSTAAHKLVIGTSGSTDSASNLANCITSGRYAITTALTGFQALMSAGNINGTLRVYGFAKSTTLGVGLNNGNVTYSSALASPPTSPVAGDLWLPSDCGAIARYSGSAWVYAPGQQAQVVNTETGTSATGTTTTPVDDTIPQITEGTEFMTLAVTPKFSTSKLKIEVTINIASNTAGRWLVAALHQDAVANALAAAYQYFVSGGTPTSITFTHYMTAGTTSSTTFRVRCGPDAAATLTFNGNAAGRFFGGVMASSITITEITA